MKGVKGRLLALSDAAVGGRAWSGQPRPCSLGKEVLQDEQWGMLLGPKLPVTTGEGRLLK